MWVISKRGRTNVPKKIPGRRERITILCYFNATGSSIPVFIYSKEKHNLKTVYIIVNRVQHACTSHAWMTKQLFLNWIFHYTASMSSGVSSENRPTNLRWPWKPHGCAENRGGQPFGH